MKDPCEMIPDPRTVQAELGEALRRVAALRRLFRLSRKIHNDLGPFNKPELEVDFEDKKN